MLIGTQSVPNPNVIGTNPAYLDIVETGLQNHSMNQSMNKTAGAGYSSTSVLASVPDLSKLRPESFCSPEKKYDKLTFRELRPVRTVGLKISWGKS